MDLLNSTTLILLVVLLGALFLIGKEFEDQNPRFVDYKKVDASQQEDFSTALQKIRAGAFVLLDFLSDAAFPGKKENAILFKRMKRTKKELEKFGDKITALENASSTK